MAQSPPETPVVGTVVSLNARAKQRRDALPEPTTFDLHGVVFTLPPFQLLPIDLQERIVGPEDLMGILRSALGAEKVAEMVAAGYTIDDAELIVEEWQARSGVEPGESQAS